MEDRESNETQVDVALEASKGKFFLNAKGPSIVILLILSITAVVAIVYIGSTTESTIAYAALGCLGFAIGSLLHTLRGHVLLK